MFQSKVAEYIKTHVLFPVTFFSGNLDLNEIMWNNMVQAARHVIADHLIRRKKDAIFLRNDKARIETLVILNTNCSSTATLVTRTCLSVTSVVNHLCC
jgi:hypothetical protein